MRVYNIALIKFNIDSKLRLAPGVVNLVALAQVFASYCTK